jgi:colanic acid/amylovoran biosynthesis glycosyltransferase
VRHGLLHRTRVLGRRMPVTRASGGRTTFGALMHCVRPELARASGGWGPLVRTLAALRGEGSFDVVHCHYGVTGLRDMVAARLWGAPLVVSFYGYDASRYPRERGERVYEPLFAAAQRVTTLSPHMDDRLRALGCPPEKIRRVPLPVDASGEAHAQIPRLASLARDDSGASRVWDDSGASRVRDDTGHSERRAEGEGYVIPSGARSAESRNRDRPDRGAEVRLLTVARLVEKKGIGIALRALGSVRHELPNVRYDVIGDGPLRAELEALASSLGIADRVRFAGALSNEHVQRAMRDADVFVLPSMTAANGDEEGTPTVLLEAGCAQLPVLATRHAGIPEVVAEGRSAVLVAENDTGALAAGLRTILAARNRWPAMGEAGRRLVIERGHLTADVAARLEALYLGIRLERGTRR